jgi:PAB1-binding protein PBP1
LYPPSLAALTTGGVGSYKPYLFWHPRPLHGFPVSPFPEEMPGSGSGSEEDDEAIRVSLRSSPDLGSQKPLEFEDTW